MAEDLSLTRIVLRSTTTLLQPDESTFKQAQHTVVSGLRRIAELRDQAFAGIEEALAAQKGKR